MKVLMIGMDGAHEEVFQRGWTPFISSLLEKQASLELTNDLLSRGWLEIATGKHASVTGAMYDMPKANGTLQWKTEFSLGNIPSLGNRVKPIWQKINELGYKVGIMNLPTTFPVPEVDGFFVSGGGGGAPVTQSPTDELCHPKDILSTLTALDYIVDDRLYQLMVEKSLKKSEEVFDRLTYKNQRRTKGFIELNKKFDVDFGFLVYKTSSVFAEQILNTELCRRKLDGNEADLSTENAIKEYYEKFDKEVEKLVETYPEAEIILVSDHGIEQRRYSVNTNKLLQQLGYQDFDRVESLKKWLIEWVKQILPFSIKYYLKKNNSSVVRGAKSVAGVGFDKKKTKAFVKTINDWTHGIYINDQRRFGGPVGETEFESVKQEIAECLNSDELVKLHGFNVEVVQGDTVEFYPDIVLKVPDGFLTTDKTKTFVEEYIAPKSTSALELITRGDILAIKSRKPMAHVSSVELSKLDFSKGGNLTRVYDYIVSRFD